MEDDAEVTRYNCRVYAGNVQCFSFAAEEDNPIPPFYDLIAPIDDESILEKRAS